MPDKAALIGKIGELRDLVERLPAGPGQMAISATISKLSGLAASAINEDGTTHPLATSFIPVNAFNPSALSNGDGHAVTCC